MAQLFYAKVIKEAGQAPPQAGQAALLTVMLIMLAMLILIGLGSALALKESGIAELNFKAKRSYFLSEAGLEDGVYRLKRGKNLPSSYTLSLYPADGGAATVTVSDVLGGKEILSSADLAQVQRAVKSSLISSNSLEFPYGAQVGAGGLEMENNSQIQGAGGTVGNVYSNGPVHGESGAKITGDLTVAGANSIDDIIVQGTARANTITDSNICGDAYYQAIDSYSLNFLNNPSSPTCFSPLTPGAASISPNSPTKEMPISDAVIQTWKNDAAAGGAITGNCGDNGVSGCDIPSNGTLSLGPKKIVGNLKLTKKQTLIVTGVLYFTGHLDMDSTSGATIKCDPSFGITSCVVIFDGWMHIKNNSIFQGSGTAGSYILMLTTLADCNGQEGASGCTHHNAAIDLHNNATGAIFYAGASMVNLHNGVNVTELTVYKLRLDNNAVVTYEQGLLNAQFSSGPTGGWEIDSWEEVLP